MPPPTPSEKTPILLAAYTLENGGTERQITEVAKIVDRSRFEAHVVAFRFGKTLSQELERAGIRTLQLPMRSFFSASYPRSLDLLRRYIRTHSIQLIHTFDPTSTIFIAMARKLLGAARVLSSQRAYRDLTLPRYRPLLRMSDRIVDGIVVNCEAMRLHLVQEEHAPAERIHVCYNGIDLGRFRPDGRQTDPESITIGTACVLRPEKNLPSLLRAFGALREDFPQARLIVVGDGPVKPEILQLQAELNLGDRFELVPFSAEVEKWLRRMDIFVLPSVSEALSNSLMEAMATGCCPVGTRVGGTPELIRPGQTGLLFETGDVTGLKLRIRQLIEDPHLRASLAANASRLIHENFSTSRMAARMQEIYRHTLDS